MSKYILEIKPEYEDSFKGVMILGAKDSNLFVDTLAVENLEQYITVDLEKIYDKASTDGYKRGLEDGKAQAERGCEGCKYAGKVVTGPPCITCCNSYRNQWTAKDDKIEVGDEVEWEGERFVILRVFTPKGCYEQCDGFDCVGNGYTNILTNEVTKTGKHFDIDKILEEMRK